MLERKASTDNLSSTDESDFEDDQKIRKLARQFEKFLFK